MDTRFWGPSGWQLFHLIAFRSPREPATAVLRDMPGILPCKFCRASTTEFVENDPPHGDLGKWLYTLHNRVNNKLRTQCAEDPAIIHPGPDPAFDEVKTRYLALKPKEVPGRDFLMSIAYNYPQAPEAHDKETQRTFLAHLAEAYPFENLRDVVRSAPPPELGSRRAYTKWMYALMKTLSDTVGAKIRSYRGYMSHLAFYKSGCARKTYRGKTCRRLPSGKVTKSRDPTVTRRVVGGSLL